MFCAVCRPIIFSSCFCFCFCFFFPSWSKYLFYVVHCLRGGCQQFLGLVEEWHCGERPRQTHRQKSWNFSHTKTIRMLELCARHYVSWSFLTSFITWEKDLYGQSYFLTFPDQKRYPTLSIPILILKLVTTSRYCLIYSRRILQLPYSLDVWYH